MANYKITIQYDGGRYKGWQRLGDGSNTIQGKIEKVLTEMTGEQVDVNGSSRTDAGVHAYSQIANFKLTRQTGEEEIKKYLNKYLPNDISVTAIEVVPELFHARYHAKTKTYLYQIWNVEEGNPFLRKYSMHVKEPLHLQKMNEGASCLIGKHDFTSFSNAKSKKNSFIRTIYSIDITKKEGLIQIRIKGDGFLYNMVRKITGALIEAGKETMNNQEIIAVLESKERNRVNLMADACGLFLESVEF